MVTPIEEQDPFADLLDVDPFEDLLPESNRLSTQSRLDIDTASGNPQQKEKINVLGRGNAEVPKGGGATLFEILRMGYDSGTDEVERSLLGSQLMHDFGGIGGFTPEVREQKEARLKELDVLLAGFPSNVLAGPPTRADIRPPAGKGTVEFWADAIAKQIPVLMSMAHDGMEAALGAGALNMAAVPLTGGAAAAALPITMSAAGSVGALNNAYNQMAGNAYLEFRNFTDEEGNKLPDGYARVGAAITGAVGTGLEAFPFALLGKMVPGLNKVFKKAGIKVTEALKFPTTTQAMKSFLFKLAKIGAAEGVTEGLQEATQIITGETMKEWAQGTYEPISTQEALARMGEAALIGTVVGGGITLPVAGAGLSGDLLQVQIDEIQKTFLERDANQKEISDLTIERRGLEDGSKRAKKVDKQLADLQTENTEINKKLNDLVQAEATQATEQAEPQEGVTQESVTPEVVADTAKQVEDLVKNAVSQEQESVNKKPVTVKSGAENIETKFDVAKTKDTFEIEHKDGAKVTGFLKNQDFPSEGIKETRGEVFFTEVPEDQRGKGLGFNLTEDAIRLIRENGGETVNLSPTTEGGKAIVAKLIKNGIISEPIKTSESGKSEHSILVEKPTPEGITGAQEEVISQVEEKLAPIGPSQKTRATLIKGRLKAIRTRLKAIDKLIQSKERQITEKKLENKKTAKLEKDVDNLLNERALLDVEEDQLGVIGLANDLKVEKTVSKEEQARLAKEEKTNIKRSEAELILEELKEGQQGERIIPETDLDISVEEQQEAFAVKSTNPPFLFGDLDRVGLKQGGKKITTRKKKTVMKMVERIIANPDMDPKKTFNDPAQQALAQRILDLIEDRIAGETQRFQPGTGLVDPFRSNNLIRLEGEQLGDFKTFQERLERLSNIDVIKDADLDTSQTIEIKGEKLVKLEEQSLKAQAKALKKGIRDGARLAKTNIKQAIKNTKQLIRSTSLPKASKDSIIAQFVTGEADFLKNIQNLQSKIANEFERLAVKEQKARIEKSLSKKSLKPIKSSGVKKGKFDAAIQSVLDNLSTLFKTSGKVNPETGQSEASLELQKRTQLDSGIVDPLGNAILNMKANPRDVTSVELEELADAIDILLAEGREAAKARLLSKQIKVQEFTTRIESFAGGQEAKLFKRTGFVSGLQGTKNWARNIAARLVDGWDEIVDRVLPEAFAKQLELGAEIQNEKAIKRRMFQKIIKAGEVAFGLKDARKVAKELDQRNQVIDYGLFTDSRGNPQRIEMSRSQATNIFMLWQDPTLRETLSSIDEDGNVIADGNALSQDMREFIFNSILTKEDKNFGLEQLKIYQEFYNEINEVYKRVHGINLDKNEFYSPILRQVDGNENTLDEFGTDRNYRASVSNPSLKARVKSVKKLKVRSDMAVFNRHVNSMARFIALREKTQLINSVFTTQSVQELLEIKYGADFNKFVNEHLISFTNGGNIANGVFDKLINTLNRNFATAQLGAKAKIGFTQLTSYFAYAETIPVTAFINGTRDFFFNMPTAIKILSQSELIKARGASVDAEIARMGATFDSKFLNKLRNKTDGIKDYLLIATKVGDRIPIFVGGWALYKHTLKKTGSKAKAMEAFNRQTAKTQQSQDIDQLSLVQKSNPLYRGMTMFMSAPIAQMRGEMRAIRKLIKGESTPKQFIKAMAIYHFILPGLYQAISNGLVAGEWDKDDQKRAAWFGSLNALAVFGDMINTVFRKVQGKRTRGVDVLKWTEPLNEVFDDLGDIFGADGDFEQIVEAAIDMFKNSGALHGLPGAQVENIEKGLQDLEDDNLKAAILRFMGWPESVAGNIE